MRLNDSEWRYDVDNFEDWLKRELKFVRCWATKATTTYEQGRIAARLDSLTSVMWAYNEYKKKDVSNE